MSDTMFAWYSLFFGNSQKIKNISYLVYIKN